MSELGERAARLVEKLGRAGAVEAYEKQGRSRRFERAGESDAMASATESGWAVRAGDARRSWFACGTGELPLAAVWPAPTPHPLWLPAPAPLPAWTAPAELASPLAGESDLRALIDAVARELERELAGARLVVARCEEGTSESALASSRGCRARVAARAATLRVEVEHGGRRAVGEGWALAASLLRPAPFARRLADRLLALAGDDRDGAPRLLLAAPLAARLVEALAPLVVGREAPARWQALIGGRAAPVAEAITLLDDGALPGGLVGAPADGEGSPTRAVTLVERGRFVQPLVAWWEAEPGAAASGCARRASFRDLPRRAPTHLYLAPSPAVAVADLLAEAGDGAFLLDAEGAVRLDPASGRFRVAVSGLRLTGGRATAGLGRRHLSGQIGDWLRGTRAAARDLAFVAGDGMFGAPTLLVEGLELEPPDDDGGAAARPQPLTAGESGSAGSSRGSSRPEESGPGT